MIAKRQTDVGRRAREIDGRTSLGGKRRPQPEVFEDVPNGSRTLNRRDNSHRTFALGAWQDACDGDGTALLSLPNIMNGRRVFLASCTDCWVRTGCLGQSKVMHREKTIAVSPALNRYEAGGAAEFLEFGDPVFA